LTASNNCCAISRSRTRSGDRRAVPASGSLKTFRPLPPDDELRRRADQGRGASGKRDEKHEGAGLLGVEASRDETRIDRSIRFHEQGSREHHLVDHACLDCRERALHRGLVLDGQGIRNKGCDRPVRLRGDLSVQGRPTDNSLGQSDDGVAATVVRESAHRDAKPSGAIESCLDERRGATRMVRTGGHTDGLRLTRGGEPLVAELQNHAVGLAIRLEKVLFRRRRRQLRRRSGRAH
jgi:hypothetical protein